MKRILIILAMLAVIPSVNAAYKETMDPNGLTKNLKKDFGMVDDNAKSDQSEKLQEAIDAVSKKGGGRLILPKGTYSFTGITMKSDVHLMIEKDTVIKPWWPANTKTQLFSLNGDLEHIENVSIRGVDGPFIVDYSNRGSIAGESIRTVNCRRVKNFLISDMTIKDSYTTYCALSFTSAKNKNGMTNTDVMVPTDGWVGNLLCTDSSPGYGLLQMHAGRRIDFENLSSIGGGPAFRLETGGGGEHGGIHDITAKNIYCENGAQAVLMGPHTSQNGLVMIDGVTVKSCSWAVTMGPGFVEEKNKSNPDIKRGCFADGSTVKNIHAIFGTNACISTKSISSVPKEYLKLIRVDKPDRKQKRVRGPSIGVVSDGTQGSWLPVIENVTQEGFKHNKGVTKTSRDNRSSMEKVLKGLPVLEEFEALKKEYAAASPKKSSKKKKH
ncbi:glycoside hydrolase family protein [Pontiella sulfatireligans]|nr:hypothetical protein [Pontiella sulfatireligans]